MSSFTPEQQEAITAEPTVPMAIVACPGSGKTFTIIQRVKYLLSKYYAPTDLLIITFTKKAAQELRERLSSLGADTADLTVSTFHSFGLSVLRRHGELIGYPQFRIVTQYEQQKVLEELAGPNHGLGSIKGLLLGLQVYKLSGDCLEQHKELFDRYALYLRQNAICDFTDLILLPLELFRHNETVLREYQRRYRYGLVDEMQDVSKTQFDLIKLMFSHNGGVTVVGDDDQTIYSFRGANPKALLQFSDHFPGAKVVSLTQCFRCQPHIVKAMSALIKNNKERVKKTVQSAVTSGGEMRKVFVFGANNAAEEAQFIVQRIKTITKGTIAVLFRTRKSAAALKTALGEARIGFSTVDKARFLENKKVNIVLNTLQKSAGLSCTETLVHSKALSLVPANATPIERYQLISSKVKLKPADSEILRDVFERNPTMSIPELMDEIKVATQTDVGQGKVVLSTVHQAKGLEWDTVFVIGATKNIWPRRQATESDIEEERRLFYVAMSRARSTLYLSFCGKNKASPFFSDVPELYFKELLVQPPEPVRPPRSHPNTGFAMVSAIVASPNGFQPVTTIRHRKS